MQKSECRMQNVERPRAFHNKRRLLLGAVLIALVIAHRPVLRWLAEALVVESAWEQADDVLAWGDERALLEVVAWQQAGRAPRVLLFEQYPERVERLGIVPAQHEQQRAQLTARGVPATTIDVIPGQPRADFQRADNLAIWLAAHPEARVQMFCSPLHTRRLSGLLERKLTAQQFARVRVGGVADAELDASRWWLSRYGLKQVSSAWNWLLVDRFCAEIPPPLDHWDIDAYERSLC